MNETFKGEMAMFRVLLVIASVMVPTVALAGESLYGAASKGDVAAMERLLNAGSAVDVRAQDGATPLMVAALNSQLEAAKLLIDRGADIMARNSGGFTPLHAAAFSGSAPIAILLLDNGAIRDDNKNKAGVSPVFVAAEMNHPELVELLIARGADVTVPEIHGYSSLTRAFWKGNQEVVSLLKRHGLTCRNDQLNASEYTRCMAIQQ
jgi:uncharacterized protein